jgi:23S rRNA G2069 N7-methylase RlmK/C1962 C5-methylase RlmI
MAAQRGASVVSIEESADMLQLVRESAQHNGLEDAEKLQPEMPEMRYNLINLVV